MESHFTVRRRTDEKNARNFVTHTRIFPIDEHGSTFRIMILLIMESHLFLRRRINEENEVILMFPHYTLSY